jgi:hypothetical protein
MTEREEEAEADSGIFDDEVILSILACVAAKGTSQLTYFGHGLM